MTVIRKARIFLKTFNFKHNFEEHLNHYAVAVAHSARSQKQFVNDTKPAQEQRQNKEIRILSQIFIIITRDKCTSQSDDAADLHAC